MVDMNFSEIKESPKLINDLNRKEFGYNIFTKLIIILNFGTIKNHINAEKPTF